MMPTGDGAEPDVRDRTAIDRGTDPELELYRSIVEQAHEMIGVLAADGTITFLNGGCASVIGGAPADYVGRNFVELLHPDDVERAVLAMALTTEHGTASGTNTFRVRRVDGSWVPVEVTQGTAPAGDLPGISVFSRPADDRTAFDRTLERLLQGAPLADTLAPVCDMFSWQGVGSRIGISWIEPDGSHEHVGHGLPVELVGADGDEGSLWAQVRATGSARLDLDLEGLDPGRRTRAEALGLGAFWVEPVRVDGSDPALITVWTAAGSRPPTNHASGMEVARRHVELILRWAQQQRRLDFAAFHDPLTGLANRAAFFEALERPPGGGALLFCDLDRFKPVNDDHGHTVGDQVLQIVADRLVREAGPDDVVARLGGDEFAVLCPGIDATAAVERAERIREVLDEPIRTAGRVVALGVSIGVAHSPDHLGPELLELADGALYAAKAAGRGAVRVAAPPRPF